MSNTTDSNNTRADLARRLQAILQELANEVHPDCDPVIFEAVGEAFNNGDAHHRHDGTLVRILLDMARTAADAGVQEMENQEGFYLEEAEFKDSDHKPAECRRYAREYAKASIAYQRTQAAVSGMGDRLAKRLKASGI